jgi:hypothetical protein
LREQKEMERLLIAAAFVLLMGTGGCARKEPVETDCRIENCAQAAQVLRVAKAAWGLTVRRSTPQPH